MYIYLAGPLTFGHRVDNNRKAIVAAHRIMQRGHFVYIPHLNDLVELVVGMEDYEFWMTQDFGWIRKCNILVRIPGKSPGADREEKFARELPILVYGNGMTDGVQEFMESKYWGCI